MDRFVCYSYCVRSAYNSVYQSDEYSEPTHTFILAGNAKTDENALCRIPLYDEGHRDPRFFSFPQRPADVNSREVAFSRVLSVTATATYMPPSGSPPQLESPPVSMTCVVDLKAVTLSPDVGQEVVVTRNISGEEPEEVFWPSSANIPSLTLYHPILIFKSWFLDGQRAANQEFSWRLEGELLVAWRALASNYQSKQAREAVVAAH